jgi:hypothetical protein
MAVIDSAFVTFRGKGIWAPTIERTLLRRVSHFSNVEHSSRIRRRV